MDRAKFFAGVRTPVLFGLKLTQAQVAGMSAILDAWEASKLTDMRWLAYMLATAFHETGQAMQPVIETQRVGESPAPTVDQAIARLESSWKRGVLTWVKTPYWRKDALGRSWLGRGFVQLTHQSNYAKLSGPVGVDLVAKPDRALELEVAITVMLVGMRDGLFTGAKLGDFFSGRRTDWAGARRIINGNESAAKVAQYAQAFHTAILSASAR